MPLELFSMVLEPHGMPVFYFYLNSTPYTTGRRVFAEGLKPSTKALQPSAKDLPRAALGEEPSGKKRRRRTLCRGPFIGHSAKYLPRANGGPRQSKVVVRFAVIFHGVFAEG